MGPASRPESVPSLLASSDSSLPPLQKHTEEITKMRNDFERQVRGQCFPRSAASGGSRAPPVRKELPSR